MKNAFYISIIALFLLVGCSSEETASEPAETTVETASEMNEPEVTSTNPNEEVISALNLTSDEPKADYEEFYADGALKISGNYDENEARHGLWISYYENGLKWSESHYSHGLKSGHSITFFPNGKVRYVGEYLEDKKAGHWTFYDEEGAIVKEEDY